MQIVERIRQLLEVRQLSPTQFADAIGVARPIVSHILSGRNKPSLEVVQRILAAMPDLSMPWLLFGTGPMLAASAAAPTVPLQEPAPPAAELPTTSPQMVAKQAESAATSGKPAVAERSEPRKASSFSNIPALKRFTPKHTTPVGHGAAPAPEMDKEATARPPGPAALLTAEVTDAPSNPPESGTAAQLLAGSEKPIRRIVIFYRDGSFADYQPE
ncbi:helix-turn-helix domain-containing protein [Hymenobacter ruricola]|uniref:Helix-turn-helix domain-containing protein n=1 Tax=Hymenobacter ruricola TaxID=2791023 RepID=A0ABS0I5S3_9BACT|nr:helix-turn-helix transcriptional regulator [Hymenobacter ruricola]MBF9222293.1 helix-turn-helix domain-containing protein [Hymenobacter ruricola]